MKVEIRVQRLVDKIEEIRKNEIEFQHTMKSTDPNWSFTEGRITSLTNVLYWYYGEKYLKEADHEAPA